MKKSLFLLFTAISISFTGIAQTNTFPNDGNVGIGTTNPTEKLHIYDGNLSITNSQGNPDQYFGEIKFYNRWASNDITAASIGIKTGNGSNPFNYSNIVFNTWNGYNTLSEKMRISSNGNVGIGTTNPSEELEIKSASPSLKLSTLDPNDNYQLKITANYDYNNRFSFKYGQAIFLQEKKITDVGGTPNSKLFLANYYGLGLSTNTSDPTNKDQIDLYITGSGASNGSGNVGIGTTTPQGKLQIKDLNNVPVLNITGKTPNTGNDELISEIRLSNLYDNLGGHRAAIKAISDKSGSHGNVAFQFNTSIWNGQQTEIQAMRISSNGDIGIGTTTPDSKLAVNGNIHAKEVKIDLIGWPDYVFESDYNLPTLQEVENHITEKGHLENIPSAAEVEKNGVQLGDMNAKLLQKIEELTLYMIEQNKKTEQLQKEVIALQKKNIELEKKIK